jgi:hypothetical protein
LLPLFQHHEVQVMLLKHVSFHDDSLTVLV